MTKVNPLFVDSTKFKGDPIATQIELRSIILYDGEELVVVVTSQQGLSCRAPMTLNDDFSFETRIHLSHQQPIAYQFFIEKDGVALMSSRKFAARAQYALIHEWEPQEDSAEAPVAPVKPKETPLLRESLAVPMLNPQATGAAWAKETSQGLKSLIEKWGL